MSTRAMIWASRLPKSAAWGGARAVLGLLADYANDDGGGAYPSVRTLATHLEVSDRSIERYLERLVRDGLICRGDQQRAARIRADRRPVVWDLIVPDGVTGLSPRDDYGVTGLSPRDDYGVTETAPRGDRNNLHGVTAAVVETRSEDPSSTPPTRDARRARVEQGGGTAQRETEIDRLAAQAVDGCEQAMPTDIADQLTDGWRTTGVAVARELIGQGWAPGQIIAETHMGDDASWRRSKPTSVGRVFVSRLRELKERRVPAAAASRAARPEWCGQCDEQTRIRWSEPPDGGECLGRCPACHPIEAPQAAAVGGGAL